VGPREQQAGDLARGEAVFTRVVAGADGGEPGYEACRQAAQLVAPGGSLEVFTAVYLAEAALAGWSASQLAEDLQREAQAASAKALELVGPDATARVVDAPPLRALLRELVQEQATLVAVGTHGHRRLTEIMIGGVSGALLHEAPCSVLIARPAVAPFPRSIVVGIDGSECADAALATAQYLAERFDTGLRIVTALHADVDLGHASLRTPFLEKIEAHPVEALAVAAERADLLVVGSRGLHGIRALGSVSERVAHRAPCSVLVVRGHR
jgi:nucleotide-binding universal stress UspA family protein